MGDLPEKEVIYQFDMVEPESFYTKPILRKHAKIIFFLANIVILIIIIESIILFLLDNYSMIWSFIPFFCAFNVIETLLINPKKRKKNYRKIHAENEDFYSYKFYDDRVNVKTPTMEATFKYDTAERYFENDELLMIQFSLKRGFIIDKKQCTDEQIDFIKNIVPKSKQAAVEKKFYIKFIPLISFFIVIAILFGRSIGYHNHVNKNTYYLTYAGTTYASFVACLEHGTVDDVLIINDTYIEYTFTGHDKDERYYTVCSGDIEDLIRMMNDKYVYWESKSAEYIEYK